MVNRMKNGLEDCTAWKVNWFTREGEMPESVGSYATKEEAEAALARFGEHTEGFGQIFMYYTCCPGCAETYSEEFDPEECRRMPRRPSRKRPDALGAYWADIATDLMDGGHGILVTFTDGTELRVPQGAVKQVFYRKVEDPDAWHAGRIWVHDSSKRITSGFHPADVESIIGIDEGDEKQ